MAYKLSICIPTYNRGKFLDEALASIAGQRGLEHVELVISDNASSDETSAVVAGWRDKLPCTLNYFRWGNNQGADANFLHVIDIAQGEFCWLLGSDDKLADGAVAALLPFLGDTSILLADYDLYASDLRTLIQRRKTLSCEPGAKFRLTNATEFQRYLSHAHELSSLFAYISTLIVRKRDWDAVKTRSEFMGSAWIHVTKALEMFGEGGELTYVGQTLILNRSGNDSFLEEVGFIRRMLIDLDYMRICDQIFADKLEMQRVMKAWLERRFFRWALVLGTRYYARRVDQGRSLDKVRDALFQRFERNPSWYLKRLAWHLFPQALLHWMRALKANRGLAR